MFAAYVEGAVYKEGGVSLLRVSESEQQRLQVS